jgi:hypothetical protein
MSSPAETKVCTRCRAELPLSSFGVRRASPDGLQGYCRACVSAWAREHRPRKLKNAPPVGPGEKWCRRCDTIKPLDAFARNLRAGDGLQGQCRECAADAYRAKREAAGAVVAPRHVPSGHKFCRSCAATKPHVEWSTNRRASDGLQTRCKACASEAARRDHLRTSYGMSVADLEAMLAAQHGVCAICQTAPAIHVDHDHATGEVRGLLCFRCNAALGQLADDPLVLRRAARYLERTTAAAPKVGPRAWHGHVEPSVLERRLAAHLSGTDLGTAS